MTEHIDADTLQKLILDELNSFDENTVTPEHMDSSREVSRDEDSFQLTSGLVEELNDDFEMDISVFLQLQELLLSDEFMIETAIHETYLDEFIEHELTNYCREPSEASAYDSGEGGSSSKQFVIVDNISGIEDVNALRSSVKGESSTNTKDDTLEKLIAEELSNTLFLSSSNSSVTDDIPSDVEEDSSSDKEDDISLENLFAEELSKAIYFEADEQSERKFDCSICMDTNLIKESDHFGCEHRYCKDCLINFLLSKFEVNQVIDISCPTEACEFKAQDIWIRTILPSNLIAKYDKIIFRAIGGQIEDIMYCPQCNESVECDLATASGLCISCGHLFCTSCFKAFHGTDDCEHIQRRNEDNEKAEQLIRTQFKKCPKCQVNIEKDFGCYHMQCTICNIDFCWRCMDVISDVESHYRAKCILFDVDMVKE